MQRNAGGAAVRATLFCGGLAAAAPGAPLPASAQNAVQSASLVETVVVTATTPLPGTGIDIDKLPYAVGTLGAADLSREGTASLAAGLNESLGSINIDNDLDDPFQPDILFRGFEASPVLGAPEGLAVYQNGVRINEAFGDTLNWDLVPAMAIDRVDLVSANPVYGLNALGGAVVLAMKNGFAFDAAEAELSGGSWGRREAQLQYGSNSGPFGWYVAARSIAEDGWRKFSPDRLAQLYGDLSYRGNGLALDLNFTGADNALSGESPTPVQELAVDRALIFTSPQNNSNRLAFVTLDGSYELNATLSLQADAYYRDYWQNAINGNTTDYTACSAKQFAGDLCQADGTTPLYGRAGNLLPDISGGGTRILGENDFESIRTDGDGGALQATEQAPLFGHDNQLSAGASIDRATTAFGSSAELGTIDSQLVVSRSGLFVDTPENTPWTATPVGLGATTTYLGAFATDALDISDALSATASGRYNSARLDLADHRGRALSGADSYARFNPAFGIADRLGAGVTVYAGYSEGSRDPTPGEIECSNPAAPCLLPSGLSSDPPTLHQVVSHTWEAGLRGRVSQTELQNGQFVWNAGLFRTDVDDDIYRVATSLSTGYFQNIGATRRQGAEAGLRYSGPRVSAFVDYAYVAATFESPLLLYSPQNPRADAEGEILVKPGDELPGIPAQRIKAGADWYATPSFRIGADLLYQSGQYFFGDEANQLGRLPGFAVLNLHARYEVTDTVELFVGIENALDARYETFGILGDPTGVGAPGIPPGAQTNGPGVDNRFESPAAPIGAFGGIRIEL